MLVDRIFDANRTILFMPPTLKKLKRHITLGLSVSPCICPSFRYKFKMRLTNLVYFTIDEMSQL